MEGEENKKENQAQPAVSEEMKELEEKLELVGKERDEYLNGWRRAKADLANYKNEEFARLEEVIKFGNSDLIQELLSVLVNFDRAIAAEEKAGRGDPGVKMIRNELFEILSRRGVKRIAVEKGGVYNPAVAEVLVQEEAEAPPGTVLEVLEDGYMLQDKVVRPAKVKISAEKENKEQSK